jgi:hypothetical protein
MKTRFKDPEKIYRELLASYQYEGYTIKQAKKLATEDTEEILMDRVGRTGNKTLNKKDK